MKKEKIITIVQYDNCKECQYCEFPDEKGEIPIPGGVLRLNPMITNREGKLIPNPVKARCGVSGKRMETLNGCGRWFHNCNVIYGEDFDSNLFYDKYEQTRKILNG
jgi:hypothetical protein